MLIGIDTRTCSHSLRDRCLFNYEMTSNKSHLKMFLQNPIFVDIFFSYCYGNQRRQSAGYVFVFQCYFCNVRSHSQFGDPSKPNHEFYFAFIAQFCNFVFKTMMAPCSSSAFCLQLRN